MKPEIRINLIKESEKIKRINSRTSYIGAWIGLFICGFILLKFIISPWGDFSNQEFSWFPKLIILMFLAGFLQSFFLIIRHLIYKRLIIIFEALLDDK